LTVIRSAESAMLPWVSSTSPGQDKQPGGEVVIGRGGLGGFGRGGEGDAAGGEKPRDGAALGVVDDLDRASGDPDIALDDEHIAGKDRPAGVLIHGQAFGRDLDRGAAVAGDTTQRQVHLREHGDWRKKREGQEERAKHQWAFRSGSRVI
jgi:hypothetical protein